MAPIDASDAPVTEKKPFTAQAKGIVEPPAAARRDCGWESLIPIRNAAGASVATNAAVPPPNRKQGTRCCGEYGEPGDHAYRYSRENPLHRPLRFPSP